MKRWLTTLVTMLVLLVSGCASTSTTVPAADRFWFIFLERGKPTPPDKDAVAAMQRGHIANFERLFGEQKLFAAGPMRDPSGHKRGIVVVKAPSRETLMGYFQPDQYVRDGYMAVNASPSVVHKPLNSVGIEPKSIEEVRIVQISRPEVGADPLAQARATAFLQSLLDEGKLGAWYTLDQGAVAEVLFVRTTDSASLETLFAMHPDVQSRGSKVMVWGQWLSKGVVL